MLTMSPEVSAAIALNDLRLFQAQILHAIMNTRSTPAEMLDHCEALHKVTQVIELYEKD
jgi:hypothetical protein